MSLKTENSRRVAKSRPVCMGLKWSPVPDSQYLYNSWDAKIEFGQTNASEQTEPKIVLSRRRQTLSLRNSKSPARS